MIAMAKYARKPFYVDAAQVTEENLSDLADWCDGDVRTSVDKKTNEEKRYVKVRVQYPLHDRQTRAFVGDWILYAGTGFKVYTDKAFKNSFDEAPEELMVEEETA